MKYVYCQKTSQLTTKAQFLP